VERLWLLSASDLDILKTNIIFCLSFWNSKDVVEVLSLMQPMFVLSLSWRSYLHKESLLCEFLYSPASWSWSWCISHFLCAGGSLDKEQRCRVTLLKEPPLNLSLQVVIDCVEDIVVLLQVWCERFGSLFGVTNLGVSDPFRCQLKCRGGDRCSWN
jgi:hypothetical protein